MSIWNNPAIVGEDPKVKERLATALPDKLINLLLDCIHEGYRIVADKHDSRLGFNNQTFGVGLYNVLVYQMMQIASENQDLMKFVARYPLFRLKVAGFQLGTYKVGNNKGDNIKSCFPQANGAIKRVEMTPYLPGFENPNPLEAQHILLTHIGNPEDLLISAFICIPASLEDNDKVTDWAFIHQIYELPNAPDNNLENIAPTETEHATPVVTKRTKTEQA